jgi:hypothetical protein
MQRTPASWHPAVEFLLFSMMTNRRSSFAGRTSASPQEASGGERSAQPQMDAGEGTLSAKSEPGISGA